MINSTMLGSEVVVRNSTGRNEVNDKKISARIAVNPAYTTRHLPNIRPVLQS
jgi:hypothetical protein